MGHEEIRIPPQNVEAEKSVLGSMLLNEEAIGSISIDPQEPILNLSGAGLIVSFLLHSIRGSRGLVLLYSNFSLLFLLVFASSQWWFVGDNLNTTQTAK